MISKHFLNITKSKSKVIAIITAIFSVIFVLVSAKLTFIMFPLWVLVSEFFLEKFKKRGFIKETLIAAIVSLILVFLPILIIVLADIYLVNINFFPNLEAIEDNIFFQLIVVSVSVAKILSVILDLEEEN